ncbi:MAG TPA: hypothetical protein VFK16_08890 [Gemmatimonadaceae bacterium]|jgi:hypothetical protein|nr:hypothetical protein [Gemmatimonadaceae bacterium]
MAVGGAIETHDGFTSCGDFPRYGVTFSGISLHDQSGSVTPNWYTSVPTSPSPDCGFDVVASPGGDTVQTIVNPAALTIDLGGPTNVDSGDVNHWEGFEHHYGLPPYTWWWTGILSGSGHDIYGAPAHSGELVVHATDQLADTATASIYVYVCDPPYAICPSVAAPHSARVYRAPPRSLATGTTGGK